MRAPAHDIWGARDHLHPRRLRRFGRGHRDGELADADAVRRVLGDFGLGPVVMARERDRAAPNALEQSPPVRSPAAFALRPELSDAPLDLGPAPAVLRLKA